MSLDRSLRVSAGMAGTRSVLTRAERIAKLVADRKIDTAKNGALGIPKTRVGKA